MKIYDVAIVGAGPAGSAAAIRLVREGAKVLLVDKKEFPRDKVCGDALIPDSLKCLRRLGVMDQVLSKGKKLDTAILYSPSRIEVQVPGEFVTIKRFDFDSLLVSEACASGVQFQNLAVSSIEEDRGGTGFDRFRYQSSGGNAGHRR